MIFRDRSLSNPERAFLICVGFLLSWKLLRLIYPSPYTWDIHNYAIVLIGLLSIAISLKHNLYLNVSKTSFVVLLFLSLSVARFSFFSSIDAFTICSLVFASYFFLLGWVMKNGSHLAFRYFEFLLLILFLLNLLDFVDANTEIINFISYEIPAFKSGTMNPLGHTSQFIWSDSQREGVVIRSVGVAGTNYASSALNAATCVYAFIMKKRIFFISSLVLLVLWGVGSSIAAAFIAIFIYKARSGWLPIYLICGVLGLIMVFDSRGFDADQFLAIRINMGAAEFLLSLILGEGKSVSSISTELRFIGLFFSLGAIGCLLFLVMLLNYFKYSKNHSYFSEGDNFKAGLFFVAVLLISTLHYNTLFVFPNLFFVVALIAFASAGFATIKKNKNGRTQGDFTRTIQSP